MNLLPDADCRDSAVEGVRFRVYRQGRSGATPALLLHGVPETAVCWRPLLPALATDRLVVAPDLKGLGGSEVVGPYDIATLVRELAALVLHEVDGPVDVVGHDWGGALAIALGTARPDLVRRLVVVNAPYRRLDLLAAFHIPFFTLPVLPEVVGRLGGRRLIHAMIRYCWRSPAPLDPAVLEHYATTYADPACRAAMLGYYRALMRRRLASLGVGRRSSRRPPEVERALVLWGVRDPVLPLPVGIAAARDLGPDTELVELPGVGHFPVEEAPERAVPVITDFLRR